jgi:hypothetical protein
MLKTREMRLPVRPAPANVPNDVYAGRDGRVYRRAQGGDWRVHNGRNWVPAQVPQTPAPVERKFVTPVDRPSPPSPPPTARPGTEPPRTERPQGTPRQPQPAPQPVQPARPPETPSYQKPPAAPAPVSSPGTLERDFQARERARAQAPTPPPTPAQRIEKRQAPQEKGKQTEQRPRRDR